MSQMGAIVLDDSINTDAWISKVKEEIPKADIGKVETTASGVKYIPIEKKSG
jgi:hypothetical protein